MCSKRYVWILTVFVIGWAGVACNADSGLVGWWRFDEGSGTAAADSSGNGNTGTLQGPEWIAPGWNDKGYCLEFLFADDESDLVDLGTMDVVGAGITITAWMNPHTFSQHDARVISKSNTAATANGHWWMLGTNNEVNARFRLKTNESDTTLTLIDTAGVIVAQEWQFIAARWDGTTAYTYVNGVETGSAAKGGTAVATDSAVPAAIGNQPANDPDGQRAWDGLIDDVRIYDRALTMEELSEVMAGAGPGVPTERALDPAPGDGASDVPRDTVLSWTAGEFAGTHDVYLGTSLEDVSAAGRDNPLDVLVSEGQSASAYDPAGLEYGQTYYWRVDEVNATPDNAIFQGDVWSFAVEPVSYPIENIAAASNTATVAGGDPAKTIDGSGLNENDGHSIDADDMWLGEPVGEESAYIEYAFDKAYKLHQMLVWNYNVQFERMLGFGLKDVTIAMSENGSDWVTFGDVEFAQGTSAEDYAANTTIDFDGVVAQYVRLTINGVYGTMGSYGLSEVRFLYVPVWAREPGIANSQTDVAPEAVLSWRSGREAASHEVYLSSDESAVVDGSALVGTVTEAEYTPDALELDTTYYWKVNEVNEAISPSVWEGSVWSFVTQEFFVVDNFESYDDVDNAIFETWIDGWTNGTGSTVGYLTEPFAEQTIVHSGGQSMPLAYDNASASDTSEADLALTPGQDWSRAGITTLTLHFRAAADNDAAQLFATIDGTRVDYDGEADVLTNVEWTTWNIDLASLGVNLANVTTLTLGIEGSGSGIVYIDDIRLYRSAP